MEMVTAEVDSRGLITGPRQQPGPYYADLPRGKYKSPQTSHTPLLFTNKYGERPVGSKQEKTKKHRHIPHFELSAAIVLKIVP